MQVGDIVIPNSSEITLRSGTAVYDFAVCVCLDPFVLSSECGNMLWLTTVAEHNFTALCTANDLILKAVKYRCPEYFA